MKESGVIRNVGKDINESKEKVQKRQSKALKESDRLRRMSIKINIFVYENTSYIIVGKVITGSEIETHNHVKYYDELNE